MTRVLLICEYTSLNGGERSLLAVLPGLQQAGYQLTVACPPDGPLVQQLRSIGVSHLAFSLVDAAGRRRSLAQLREQLKAVILQNKPMVVHANSLMMSRLAGPVTRELDVPGIGHLRDMMKLSATALADLGSQQRLLAVSAATKRWYTALGIDENRIHVLYNGVDLDRFKPREPTDYLHRELQLSSHVPLVGCIGQIGMRKGTDVLVQAARLVVRSRPDVHFVLVGQRYSEKEEARFFEQQLHDAAGQGILAGHVHFLGLRDDVALLLSELAVLAHASRQEPLGRVLLEGAASGVAIVATHVGGTEEIFPRDTEAACIVPPDDADALARSIERLLNDGQFREKVAQTARQRAELQFDCRRAARQLADHYESVSGTAEKLH